MKPKNTPDGTVVRVVERRQENDCALCAFCTLTGVSYEDALVAVSRIEAKAGKDGLYFSSLQRLAKAFGFTLRLRRKADLTEDTGILKIMLTDHSYNHAVVLKQGQIIDSDGTIWSAETYLANMRCQPGSLLVLG